MNKKKGSNEQIIKEIQEMLEQIKSTWQLEEIKRFISNITKE